MHNKEKWNNYALMRLGIEKLKIILGSYQSGQLGLTVTQLSFDFGGSNPSLPTTNLKIEKI